MTINKSTSGFNSLTASKSLSRSSSSQNIAIDNSIYESNLPKIEYLLFQSAYESAKEGGVQELLEQIDEAQTKYIFSSFILQAISRPTDFAPITSKFAQIRLAEDDSFNRLFERIRERIK